MRSISPSSSVAPPPTPAMSEEIRGWQSPVPYLFGGLAAMLGLISFALLLLGCSYWKLWVQSEERDLEDKTRDEQQLRQQTKGYEEKVLVIMAGDQEPSFLATPLAAPTAKPFGYPQNQDRPQ